MLQGAFAKHSVAKIMITRRGEKGDNPRYGAPPLYYASCCDGFQVRLMKTMHCARSGWSKYLSIAPLTPRPKDVFAADMAVALEWGLPQWAHDIHDNYYNFYVRRHATVLYRGPELAQYGRQLTLAAQ